MVGRSNSANWPGFPVKRDELNLFHEVEMAMVCSLKKWWGRLPAPERFKDCVNFFLAAGNLQPPTLGESSGTFCFITLTPDLSRANSDATIKAGRLIGTLVCPLRELLFV
jgi:hypothetical protein